MIGINTFAYCGNNPVNYSDPSGKAHYYSYIFDCWVTTTATGTAIYDYDTPAPGTSNVSGPVNKPLKNGYTYRRGNDNFGSPGDVDHVHISKNGQDLYDQNADGTPHHLGGTPPKPLRKKLKELEGWDWDNPPGIETNNSSVSFGQKTVGSLMVLGGVCAIIILAADDVTGIGVADEPLMVPAAGLVATGFSNIFA